MFCMKTVVIDWLIIVFSITLFALRRLLARPLWCIFVSFPEYRKRSQLPTRIFLFIVTRQSPDLFGEASLKALLSRVEELAELAGDKVSDCLKVWFGLRWASLMCLNASTASSNGCLHQYRLDRHFGSKPEIGLPALGPLAPMHPRELCRNMGPGQDQLLPLFSHLNSGTSNFMSLQRMQSLSSSTLPLLPT